MSYEVVLRNAWKITWRYKYLWLFGFIAGIPIGSIGNLGFAQGGAQIFFSLESLFSNFNPMAVITVITAVVVWLAGTAVRSSLIHEVGAHDSNKRSRKPTKEFMPLFRLGANFIPRILMMQVIVWLPLIILTIISQFASRSAFDSVDITTDPAGAAGLIGAAVLLSFAIILIAIPLVFIDALSYRAIVIEDLSAIDGIRRGIEVFKGNIVKLFGLAVTFFVLGLVLGFIVLDFISPFAFALFDPDLMSGATAQLQSQMLECQNQAQGNFEEMQVCMETINAEFNSNPTVIVGTMAISTISGLLYAAFFSVYTVFQSAAFTVAYQRLADIR